MSPTTICTDALRQIGVLRPGQTANPDAIQDCFRQLNMMVQQWSIQRWTVKVKERRVNTLTAGVSTYTIGPSGDWVTDARPTTIDYCTVLQTSGTTTTEWPIIMATEQQWAQKVYQKALATSPAALIYIRYTLPNLTAQIWPVPAASSGVSYAIGIYYGAQLPEFSNVTDDIALQPGFGEALVKCLAVKIWPMFMLNNKVIHQLNPGAYNALYETVKREADHALGWIKSLNAEESEMACSRALDDRNFGLYNVYGDVNY